MDHIHVTESAGKAFFSKGLKGPVVMLNLLRFKRNADYSASPMLSSSAVISGYDAYKLYMQAVIPLLEKAGSKLLYKGKCHDYLIGPTDETWDLMLLVQHENVDAFLAFANDPAYQKIAGHRTAALADSRLLPLQ